MENKQNGSNSSSNMQKAENNQPSTQNGITAPDEQHPQEYRNFNSDFLQNHQLPNVTEVEMVLRLLEHMEHVSRNYDRFLDEYIQQCDEIDQRLDYLLGAETVDSDVDIGDDEHESQEVDVPQVGAEAEEPMEEVTPENLNGADFHAQHQHEEDMCCICLGAYQGGEEKRKLECDHVFHYNCIGRWLMRKNSCPLCNRPVVFNLH